MNLLCIFNKDSFLGSLTGQIIAGLIVIALGYLIKEIIRYYRQRFLKTFILTKRFVFFYNPTDKKWKEITFLKSGEIGSGKNNNEYSWKLKWRKLEIYSSDGKLYSRFKYDKNSGNLVSTNEPQIRAIHDQYLTPYYEHVGDPNHPDSHYVHHHYR